LDLQHAVQVNLALGSGQPIASNLHPSPDGAVGLFGIVLAIGTSPLKIHRRARQSRSALFRPDFLIEVEAMAVVP